MTPASKRANWFALACCAFFICLGALWIWLPGIQSDEALFSAAIYSPDETPANRVRVFGRGYTLMVMSYVGALKARLWSPIFRNIGVSAATIRFPALVVGALSIWAFYRLMLRTLGVRPAVIGCGLLACDTLYLLTVRWDWGPVALQHLLLITGMLAIVKWHQGARMPWLALGSFLFGLAMWDKALFAWSLVGLSVATAAVFPRELLRALRPRTLAVAGVAFLTGASPLLIYNVRNNWVTFRSSAERSTEDINYKIAVLLDTFDGSAMFGLARPDSDGNQREPAGTAEGLVVHLSESLGQPRHHLLEWLLLGTLLALPMYWRTPARRAVLFSVIFCVVTWVQMVPLQNGGTGVHHTILLWPMPVMAAAAAVALLPVPAAAAISAVTMVSGLLVTGTYYRDMIRNGGTAIWSDAIYPAADALRPLKPVQILLADWGFWDNLRVFGKGWFPLNDAADPARSEAERKWALEQIAEPRCYFVRHLPGAETEPGRADRLIQFAFANGYRRGYSKVISDSNRRPIIEIFSFEKATNPATPLTLTTSGRTEGFR